MRCLIACLVLVCCVQSSHAGSVTGIAVGVANIEVQQFVRGVQVGPTLDYAGVPSTLSYAITPSATSTPFGGSFAFTLINNIFSIDSTNPDPLYRLTPGTPEAITAQIIDGIPGQSSDYAAGGIVASIYHLWYFQGGVSLTDPTGQYIGPNGDGDPAGVLVTAQYVYQPWDFSDTGQTYTVAFTTVPEPASILLALAAILIFVFACTVTHVLSLPRKQS